MGAFADTAELVQFTRVFLRDRTDSLQRDVLVCTHAATAAFPAILYCLSTIDLLGALLGGDAKSSSGVSDRAKAYARRFMHYSVDQCDLLWGVFRHKIVHLAQPNPVKLFKGKKTTWGYWHDDAGHHLTLVPLDPALREIRASGLLIEAEQRFEISIRHLGVDIVDSINAPGGYLHTLASDPDLQDKFTKAITEIHEP
jgi:hypothetical protein